MNDDLISRQAAIEATYDVLASYSYIDEPGSDVAERVENILKEMPSVQQKTGRWLVNSDGYYPYCSLCKNEPQGRIMTDYCPNCGADMREETGFC